MHPYDPTVDRILELVTERQRSPTGTGCATRPCPGCAAAHGGRIAGAVAAGEPVEFLLPAFPGKSPNRAKVLGPLPDRAEELSLAYLDRLCRQIAAVHPPGARVVVCSDGRVFGDVVGIPDDDVTAYQRRLHQMVPPTVRLFHLDDAAPGRDFDGMRAQLLAGWAGGAAELRAEVAAGGPAAALYRGITRFLVEDAYRPGQQLSRSAVQRDARERAYEVIRRSRAWGELVGARFPDAVRLSIHPQACGAPKLGISLVDTADDWTTAWHGVAVDLGDRYVVMKRHQAESLDAELVLAAGRPSHFRLRDPRAVPDHVRRATRPDPLAEETPDAPIVV